MEGARGDVQQDRMGLDAIADRKVVEAMEKASRHPFLSEASAAEAAQGRSGGGRLTPEPMVTAAMIEALRLGREDRVLEVGTGSGFQTAVLGELVGAVYSVEADHSLAEERERSLGELGYDNIRVRAGDGSEGWIEEAPFDAIIVAAAVEEVPPALMDQLKDGGRLVIPMGTPFGAQELTLIEKRGSEVITRRRMPVQFVSFRRALGHGASHSPAG